MNESYTHIVNDIGGTPEFYTVTVILKCKWYKKPWLLLTHQPTEIRTIYKDVKFSDIVLIGNDVIIAAAGVIADKEMQNGT